MHLILLYSDYLSCIKGYKPPRFHKPMNILIRRARKGDGKSVAQMWNAGITNKFYVYNGGNEQMKRKDIFTANKKYGDTISKDIYVVAEDKDKKIIVGSCGAYGNDKGRTRHRKGLGWGVHPEYAGQGIATMMVKKVIAEAKKQGLKRLEAEAAIENVASVKLAKKCGFVIEGKRKNGLLLDDGRYVDTYLFGILI